MNNLMDSSNSLRKQINTCVEVNSAYIKSADFTSSDQYGYNDEMGKQNGEKEALLNNSPSRSSYLCTLKHFTEAEIDKLRKTRQILILKEFTATLAPKEQSELRYLHWQIDRYEMAKDKEIIERQESLITKNSVAVDAILNSFGINYEK